MKITNKRSGIHLNILTMKKHLIMPYTNILNWHLIPGFHETVKYKGNANNRIHDES